MKGASLIQSEAVVEAYSLAFRSPIGLKGHVPGHVLTEELEVPIIHTYRFHMAISV